MASTVIIADGCSRTKKHTPVVGIMLRTRGGALAQVFRKFLLAHHIQSQCTACRTPVILCCSIFARGKKIARDAPFWA